MPSPLIEFLLENQPSLQLNGLTLSTILGWENSDILQHSRVYIEGFLFPTRAQSQLHRGLPTLGASEQAFIDAPPEADQQYNPLQQAILKNLNWYLINRLGLKLTFRTESHSWQVKAHDDFYQRFNDWVVVTDRNPTHPIISRIIDCLCDIQCRSVAIALMRALASIKEAHPQAISNKSFYEFWLQRIIDHGALTKSENQQIASGLKLKTLPEEYVPGQLADPDPDAAATSSAPSEVPTDSSSMYYPFLEHDDSSSPAPAAPDGEIELTTYKSSHSK